LRKEGFVVKHTQTIYCKHGFTLIELLITVAILGVLIALAGPSFANLLASNRASSVSTEVASSIMFARAEAVKRGMRVTMCKSITTDQATPTCDTSNSSSWANGWLIFTDTGTVGTFDAGTDVRLKVAQPAIRDGSITSSSSNFANFLSFDSRGNFVPSGGVLTTSMVICYNHHQRTIEIAPTGRLHTIAGSC
jgi:type IV fimbrial biogenesis protein FimT